MAKRNKLRYQSKGNQFPPITTTGNVYMRYREEEAIARAVKGDLQIYLSTDSAPFNTHIGDWDAMGLEGYLKAEVFDDKGWKPLSLEEFFPDRLHYFGKREKPIDTYSVCLEPLRAFRGATLIRLYREHYVKVEAKPEEE